MRRRITGAIGLAALLSSAGAGASEVVEVLPLTDRVLMVHFDDGHVVRHGLGQARGDDQVVADPLDVTAASSAASYSISSPDDPAFSGGVRPSAVHRKSKMTEGSWICRWNGSGCGDATDDHVKEHWLYLVLPSPLVRGKTYTVDVGGLATNGATHQLTFDETRVRSEAVHVNLIGFAPAAPGKYGYVYHWMGDGGGLDLADYAGRGCHLVDLATGDPVFDSTLVFRKGATNPETAHAEDTPNANFLGADVYACDFSSFARPGAYTLSVDGVGSSFPFRLHDDVYREPFYFTMKGLFLNRSGIDIDERYGDGFARPAPHHPALTPGFSGKLRYSSARYFDMTSESGDTAAWEAAERGAIDTWGWYQDAGDWDGYPSHHKVPALLLFLYEAFPSHFVDGELGIPESGNGLPDVLDEAAWLIRFYHRTRHAIMDAGYGTGGVGGARVTGDNWGGDGEGVPSWLDVNRLWYVSGEDPWMTYIYAGLAAQLAYVLDTLGRADPSGVDWRAEAEQSYVWARANTRAGDETPHQGYLLSELRAYAATALYRLTGTASYHQEVVADLAGWDGSLTSEVRYAVMLYATLPSTRSVDAALQTRARDALNARSQLLVGSGRPDRATRWGGDLYMPQVVGQATTPLVEDAALARGLLAASRPGDAATYLAGLYTTADYFLGTNPLNMTYVTGMGERFPLGVMKLDSWYSGHTEPMPGVVPYGPTGRNYGGGWPSGGPWEANWARMPSKIYPSEERWPGHETWFDQYTGVLSSEFTVHQNTVQSAVVYGSLTSERYVPWREQANGTGGTSGTGGTGGTGGTSATGGTSGTGGTIGPQGGSDAGGTGGTSSECTAPWALCGGVCVDVGAEPGHCGACGNACASEEVCAAGTCALACGDGGEVCDRACVDTQTSGSHCGACGVACGAGASCQAGTCACTAPLSDCGAGCVSTASDPRNCGACGTACDAGLVCSLGACKATCDAGLVACGGACVELTSSLLHCGGCDQPCAAGQLCTAGACSCAPGLMVCDGACVDLGASAVHCGACGVACAATQVCSAGVCVGDVPRPPPASPGAAGASARDAGDERDGGCGCAVPRPAGRDVSPFVALLLAGLVVVRGARRRAHRAAGG